MDIKKHLKAHQSWSSVMILYFLLLLFVSAKKNHTFKLKISKRNNNPIASGASALARFSSTKTNVNLKNIGNYFYQVYVYIGNGQSFLLDLDVSLLLI